MYPKHEDFIKNKLIVNSSQPSLTEAVALESCREAQKEILYKMSVIFSAKMDMFSRQDEKIKWETVCSCDYELCMAMNNLNYADRRREELIKQIDEWDENNKSN